MLLICWLLTILAVPAGMPLPIASLLTFGGLFIAPGTWLADLLAWRAGLDRLERLALAFPLGVGLMAGPGIVALVGHFSLEQLTAGWIGLSVLVLILWLLHTFFVRNLGNLFRPPAASWTKEEGLLLLFVIIAFVALLPALTLPKIDGDAYAVNAFSADALAGLPLNATEPLFGTNLGPGVRMVFNQSLTMFYLWSHLSGIDPNSLIAAGSRPVLAAWAILAIYLLGKRAGNNNRRLGLLTAAVQILIYAAAPFLRADNVSSFFFERINADKFMVPVTMLPVILGLVLMGLGHRPGKIWWPAALSTFAVSTIHPLIAAMLALSLAALATVHLLAGRLAKAAWQRAALPIALVGVVMFLPILQLFLSQNEAPLAPSYPRTFEGWPIGEKQVPILPYVNSTTLDLYGPQPNLSQLEANAANTPTNPFLLWRFAVNMARHRLILFDLNYYISDPSLILEPPYILALLLLPFLVWGRWRQEVAVQFGLGTALALLLVMFNPLLTPLIGRLVMPWILWRLVWLLPYALIIALALRRVLDKWPGRTLYLPAVLLLALLLGPAATRHLNDLRDRAASPYFFPVPAGLFTQLNQITAQHGPITIMADSDLSVTIPAYVAQASIIAHRAPTTSEVFPRNQQDVALQRLIDQDAFYRSPQLTPPTLAILTRYQVDYVVVRSGSDLDTQLGLANNWFVWQASHNGYSLYAVGQLPAEDQTLLGNAALSQRDWAAAESHYQAGLATQPADLLAMVGLAEVAHSQGQFETAVAWLTKASQERDLPGLHYLLGQIYVEEGNEESGRSQFEQAVLADPSVARYRLALGDACLALGRENCASDQYQAAALNQQLPDEAARLIAQADLWRQRGRMEQAIALYEQAVTLRPSTANLFILENSYQESGRYAEAEQVLAQIEAQAPLFTEIWPSWGRLMAIQGRWEEAIGYYRRAIATQNWQLQESVAGRLDLAQALLQASRPEQASQEIEQILALQPFNPLAHRLQGDLYRQLEQFDKATQAYQRAYELDPTQIGVYVSLSDQLRQHGGGRPEHLLELLQATIQANPDEAILYLALGDQWQLLGNNQAAIDAYQAALDLLELAATLPGQQALSNGESRAFAYARLARAYQDLGQLPPAMNYYRAAMSATGGATWTRMIYAEALHRNRDFGAAQAVYQSVLEQQADNREAYLGLAELAIDQGDLAGAEALLQQLLARAPDEVAVYLHLGNLEQRRGNLAAALGWFQQAATLPLSGDTVNLALLDSLTRYGDFSTALQYVTTAVSLRPADSELLFRLGVIQQATGHYLEAQTALSQAQALGLRDNRLYTALAETYLAVGQPQQALTLYQEAIDLRPTEEAYYLAASRIWLSQGRFDQAEQLLRLGLGQATRPEPIYIALAHLYLGQNQPDLALETLQQGVEATNQAVQLLEALGRYYLSRADFEQAAAQYQLALAQNPQAGLVYVALADLALLQGKNDQALAYYQQAVTVEPESPGFYLALGSGYARLGRPDEAIASYQQALNLAPDLENGYTGLAALYQANGRWPEAEETFLRGLIIAPTSNRLIALYVAFLLAQERPQQALDFINRAIAATPTAPAFIARATVYAKMGQPEAAIEDLQTALSQEPGSLEALVTLGDLYRGQGDFGNAEITYNRLATLLPGVPLGYLRLGELANQQGNLEQAAQYAEIARALEPGLLSRPEE